MKQLDARSLKRLEGVHEDLVRVVRRAFELSPNVFIVTEGLRTLARQKQLLAAGASQTLRSRHLTGHAVDLAVKVGSEIRWDWPLYSALAVVMKDAAKQLNIPLEWGGDWKSLVDGPHYQLPWADYPLT
jgi:peptidoglycan L-alanyl-D-glutamate endopeptidase CwlK